MWKGGNKIKATTNDAREKGENCLRKFLGYTL